MRCIASSLALICTVALQAQTPRRALARPDSAQQDRTLESVRQFVSTHLDRAENLSCVETPAAADRTLTVEFAATPEARRGATSAIDPSSLVRDVFAVSSGTEIHFDHWGTLRGQKVAVYNYGFVTNGKTHSGRIFADPDTGAITRMIFRGADAAAHLFCSTRP